MFCTCMDLKSQPIMASSFDNTITSNKVASGGTTLLIIDAQNDFHPGDDNSLSVPNADEDAKRITKLITDSIDIQNGTSSIQRIVATLDTHHKLHIAHPTFWINDQGKHPVPFTFITSSDIEEGLWKPRSNLKLPFGTKSSLLNLNILNKGKSKNKIRMNPIDGSIDLLSYVLEYTKALESQGKFQLQIWPEHCLIGSRGHNIVPNIHDALTKWSDVTGTSVEYVTKGENLLTEMYSVLKAEVPISVETEFNNELFLWFPTQIITLTSLIFET